MDSREAMELVDAHLDGEELNEEQASALTEWIKQSPEQADDVFRRIFLHAYLRRSIQVAAIASTEHVSLEGSADHADNAPTDAAFKQRTQWGWWTWSVVIVAILGCAGLGLALSSQVVGSGPADPFVYEPFDYPGFDYQGFGFPEIPDSIPLGVWPSEGGTTGRDGGSGFAAPWQEEGHLVSVIESDPMAHPLGKVDLRQFSRLSYIDSQGAVLQTNGNQLRTSAGDYSSTTRTLNVEQAPANLRDGEQLGADGGTLWLSFLAQSYDGSGEHRYAFLELGSPKAGLHVGKLTSIPNGNWGIAGVVNGQEVNARSSDTSSGESVFVVVRLEFRPGMELATVWLNPNLGVEPSENTAFAQMQVPDLRFDRLTFTGRFSTDFDEIRLGQSYHDVAPVAAP
ncbi:hypothetical protein AB1K70_14370 [Bremerella sp. JC770]|uniref:anti-sigma factor family protein n=1 Tax=Bremerella sp. JC770 TaxID=3232137 RepID=UPI00345AE8A3